MRDRAARAYSPEDGRALRVPLPWFLWGNRLVGSHDGGWIATASGSHQLLVVNLFSDARAPLSAQQSAIVCACPVSISSSAPLYVNKIICSTDPSSSSCILAGMTERCRIAFDISTDQDGNPVASPVQHLGIQMNNALQVLGVTFNPRYIFQRRGKLAIAVEVWPRGCLHEAKTFKVFDLADCGTMLKEVTSLNEYTLFLGQECSKAVPVSAMDGRGGVERNRIYYTEQHCSLHQNVVERLTRLDVGGCTVYCCKSEGVHRFERIMSCGYHYDKWDGSNGCNILACGFYLQTSSSCWYMHM
ncbi:hypothetical protein D1007_23560 [Hordeum vulgare]|nr:hypothetical protein D1007_23560 [Hordeum vulgare]